ncbi:MAG: two-component sensor histidine kinase [Burkholderiales bacterium RIFCSPLOWO2_12_67_14]|nr:MAG: two-component sensor histidine kinase [Burkholderiales bacterium RIFCSPLOWO2_02_FULL_67_64]OGB39930.1 MAG: two-component sensor histidine kinase [Burkholderiales bacterium RIFCSPLOWO2_12_67_14]OGB52584.1 MAG: two-component sensor histidine kinase [Burkholderiales bacterium RIFCSPHIGHO2_12_FULL_67_38]
MSAVPTRDSRVPFETQPAALETAPAPLEMRPQRGVSLFWRTFFFLALLLVGCIVAWLQTFRALEFEPRALQSAQQLASLVNLSRAALVHSDSIARVSLVKTLADEEGVRIAPREPNDTYKLYNTDSLSQNISERLSARLGPGTVVAREVNGFPGLWVGFNIDDDPYWLLTDPSRVGPVTGATWLIWLATAAALSLAGAALIARLINHPLKKLSFAASRVREGDFNASQLNEMVATSEIREVNIGFNRMAQRLSKVEQDRALMLAGISHDLRTPLARLRLETEMSVADPQAREHMTADIEQVNAIIDKFLDYARPDQLKPDRVNLNQVVDAAIFSLGNDPTLIIETQIPPDTFVLGEAVELQRVFSNLLENTQRYGRNPETGMAEVGIAAKIRDDWVLVKLRDHGPGVSPDQLQHLTQPFFRGDASRTSATGTGLGLAIVERAIARMGGRFAMANSSTGGLSAHMKLPKAPD